jgi:hypothetical protein
MLDAELFELSLMPLQNIYNIRAIHRIPVATYTAAAEASATYAAFSRASLARISESFCCT